jgi:hypothetical protein
LELILTYRPWFVTLMKFCPLNCWVEYLSYHCMNLCCTSEDHTINYMPGRPLNKRCSFLSLVSIKIDALCRNMANTHNTDFKLNVYWDTWNSMLINWIIQSFMREVWNSYICVLGNESM